MSFFVYRIEFGHKQGRRIVAKNAREALVCFEEHMPGVVAIEAKREFMSSFSVEGLNSLEVNWIAGPCIVVPEQPAEQPAEQAAEEDVEEYVEENI